MTLKEFSEKKKKNITLVKTTFLYLNIRIYSHKRPFRVQCKEIITLDNETNK